MFLSPFGIGAHMGHHIIGQILQRFAPKKKGKWLDALPAVKFEINSAVNAATGMSPLDLILGLQATLFDAPNPLDDNSPPALSKWLSICKKAWATAQDQLCTSCIKKAIQHNKHIANRPTLALGTLALLNTADWRALCQPGSNKLKNCFEGPYPILRIFNHGQRVELDLLANNLQHLTFHVSKIKPFVSREESLGE
jgi:hypothetical protein